MILRSTYIGEFPTYYKCPNGPEHVLDPITNEPTRSYIEVNMKQSFNKHSKFLGACKNIYVISSRSMVTALNVFLY